MIDNIEKVIGFNRDTGKTMIGDVLEYMFKNNLFEDMEGISFFVDVIWKNKRLSIEEQSIDCIKYIYNLTKGK